MKKGKLIVVSIAIVVLAVGGMAIKKYYDERYKSTDYYALVRTNTRIEPGDILDMSDKVAGQGHTYNLRSYNEQGEMVNAQFSVFSDNSNDFYQDGIYLKIEHSKSIVIKQTVVSKDQVPEKVLKYIENDTKENK